jgi:medium-chain acyl-[acyl-carrier-protein] hydrolase
MMVSTGSRESGSLWFKHLSPAKAPSFRLFCFPYAGGSADVYGRWQRWFPEQIDICLVHLPGRGNRLREPAFTRLVPLVNAIADSIIGEIDVRYALYGHSMGALISFELARELFRRQVSGPAHVLVSGRCAPQLPRSGKTTFNLPDDEFIAHLKSLNGTPPQVFDDPELMDLFLSPLRADFEAVQTYQYTLGERLTCPITVYGGLQDNVRVACYRAWKEQTSAACKLRMFKGDHFFIRNPGPDLMAAFRNDVLSAVPGSLVREI